MAFHPILLRAICGAVLGIVPMCVRAGPAPAADEQAAAPSATASYTVVDTIVVRAGNALQLPAPQVGSVVTHIALDEARGARDLGDILGASAGLQVRRYGAAGASAVPSLRGSAPAQIRLYIDGMPLDDAQSGLFDLSRLPVERFDAVDVHRGGVPARLGGIGGAGAVNLRTRRQTDGAEVVLGAGSWGELSTRGTAGFGNAADGSTGLVVLHGRRADNDFEYDDHKWTFHVPDDDESARRENSWLREHGAFAAAGARLGADWLVRGWAGFLRRDGGRPGPIGGYASPHATVRYDRLDGFVSAGWRDGLVRFEMAGARTNEVLYDPEGEVGMTPPGETRSRADDVTLRAVLAPRFDLGHAADLELQLGVEGRDQWYDHAFAGLREPQRNRQQTTVFGALDAGLTAARLRVSPSVRWQRNRDDFPPVPPLPWLPEEEGVVNVREDWSPAFGIVWDAAPGALVVAVHGARSVRVPTWVELFGHRGGIAGNRDLRPERIETVDAGLTVHPARALSCRFTAFLSETEDTIVFVPNSQQTSKGHNIGASRTRGLELEVQGAPGWALVLQANVTIQESRDRSGFEPYDGKSLPYLPDREAYVRLRRNHRVLAPWAEVLAQSSNYRDRANTEAGRAAARGQLNLGVDWTWSLRGRDAASRLTLAGAVLNVTDRRDHDMEGFPLPGRSWRASVRYRP